MQRQIFEDQAVVEKQNYEALLQEWKAQQEENCDATRASSASAEQESSYPELQDEPSSAVSLQRNPSETPMSMPSLRCVSLLSCTRASVADLGSSSAGMTNEDTTAPDPSSSLLRNKTDNDPQLAAMRSRVDQTLAKLQETLNDRSPSSNTNKDWHPPPSDGGLVGVAIPWVAADNLSFGECQIESTPSCEEKTGAGFDCSEPLDSSVLDHLFD